MRRIIHSPSKPSSSGSSCARAFTTKAIGTPPSRLSSGPEREPGWNMSSPSRHGHGRHARAHDWSRTSASETRATESRLEFPPGSLTGTLSSSATGKNKREGRTSGYPNKMKGAPLPPIPSSRFQTRLTHQRLTVALLTFLEKPIGKDVGRCGNETPGGRSPRF